MSDKRSDGLGWPSESQGHPDHVDAVPAETGLGWPMGGDGLHPVQADAQHADSGGHINPEESP